MSVIMKYEIDNKNKILSIALTLFADKGYDAVGVQQLCDEVGISKPTLYYYFGSKANLLREIMQCHYEKFNEALSAAAVYSAHPSSYTEDVYPVLLRVAETYFYLAANNRKFYRIVLNALCVPEASDTKTMTEEYNSRQYQIIEEMFYQMSEIHGNMKDREKRLAWTFIGIINTYIMLGETEYLSAGQLVHDFMHGIFS